MLHVELIDSEGVEVDWASLEDDCLAALLATGFDYHDPFINVSDVLAREVCYAIQTISHEEHYLRLYGDDQFESMVRFLKSLEGACEQNQNALVFIYKKED